ncbi:unnamed protein product, partial [Nippostrongylus brasiliensis]|uniref:Rubis-subs-bind domain-containing protein n=1 Tax=Nippostrongylus brasiliensis TaxID=27835 RepID=A0A0N4XM51_NIPBR
GLDHGLIVSRWHPHTAHSPNVQAVSFFRLLLQKMTDPPEGIQRYALRIAGKSGRDMSLKTLPEEVETILIDFALDMLGYGQPEIKCRASVALEESRFFASLGGTYEERSEALSVLVEEREGWKKQMNRSLQLALRDIRSYTYGQINGVNQWIKSRRQKKVQEQREDEDLEDNVL